MPPSSKSESHHTSPHQRVGSSDPRSKDPLVGQKLGNIRVERVLGAGGMGQVYAGFDEKLKRAVALKSIRRTHAENKEMKARFLQEARLLSRLQHPNICRIYDYEEGTDSDFLVLELIEGRTLKDIPPGRLSMTEKLKVARQLASVLAAAHDAGVVHRDLKPANMMLTPSGDVKMLDFGIAHSVEPDLVPPPGASVSQLPEITRDADFQNAETHATPVASTADDATRPMALEPDATHRAVHDLTTPLPLKIEQELHKQSPSDTQTAPSHAQGQAADQQMPGKTQILGETTVSAAEQFRTQTGSVVGTPQFMSPEQARGERADAASDMYSLGLLFYELFTGNQPYPPKLSLFELLARVQDGNTLPVEGLPADLTLLIERLCSAAPGSRPSALDTEDRLRWIEEGPTRRRRKNWKRGGVALLILVAAVMSFQALRIRQEAQKAAAEAETSRRTLDFFVSLFDESNPWESRHERSRGSDLTVSEALDRGIEKLQEDLQDRPLIRARLLHNIGRIQTRMGHWQKAEALLKESLQLRRDEQPDELEIAGNLLDLGDSVLMDGRYEETELSYRAAIDHLKLFPEEPEVIQTRALAHLLLGTLLAETARFDEAMASFNQALITDPSQDAARREEHSALVLTEMATVQEQLGHFGDAEISLRSALEGLERHFDDRSPFLGQTHNRLGIVLDRQNRPKEAVESYLKAVQIIEGSLGVDHPMAGTFRMNLGSSYRKLRRYDDADEQYRQAEEVFQAKYGESNPRLAELKGNRGNLLLEIGRYPEAAASFDQARAIFSENFGEVHPAVGLCLLLKAKALRNQGLPGPAETGFAASEDLFAQVFSENHPETLSARRQRAEALIQQGQLKSARDVLAPVLAAIEPILASEHDDSQGSLVGPAKALLISMELERRSGELARASEVDQQIAHMDVPEEEAPHLKFKWLQLRANLQRDLKNVDEAFDFYRQAQELGEELLPEQHPLWIELLRDRAVMERDFGDSDQADALDAEARALAETFQITLLPPRP